jgi:hypothetical protein
MIKDRFSLRFKREVQFPRFRMDLGEVWDCTAIGKTGRGYLEALATSSGRFAFAGGVCLTEDVERVADIPPGYQHDLWEAAA